MNQSPVILFDGICNFCCGWVQFIIRNDTNSMFRFAPIQSEIGKRMLHEAGINNNIPESVVYFKGHLSFRESSAVLEILKDLGGMWKTVEVLKLIPKPVRDGMYQFIAKRRYRYFGKRVSCLLPSPENKKRFLT